MALILNIDTSSETASICLSKDAVPLMIMENKDQKDHAAWLHVAVKKMMHETGYATKDLQAIAVAIGPGSYTGLRVGMAAAKGFSYALHIPLITENTLYLMAFAVKDQVGEFVDALICPMIDARRMEVFTALYSKELREIATPSAMILNKNSFEEHHSEKHIYFTGSGAHKWKELNSNPNAGFLDTPILAQYLGNISHNKYLIKEFTDLIYSEPTYVKDFFTHAKK
jgi:tRNA threonylcarbamoyladenosine biosynthesis protein TsaB